MNISVKEILKFFENNKPVLKNYYVKRVGLPGAYIRNKQRPGSDIEILVEYKKGHRTFDNFIILCEADL